MLLFQSRPCVYLQKKSQSEGARGMATLKAISVRLKSVKNIQKITQSMKMVSAAKFARAERDLKQARPFGGGFKLFYEKAEFDKVKEAEKEVPKKTLYVAISSDRGLCGAIHTAVAKILRNDLEKADENVKMICVGDKARSLLNRLFRENFLFICQEVGRTSPTFLDASRIANEILHSEFEFNEGRIIYNRFRSVVSYVTEILPFYNVDTYLNSNNVQNYEDADAESIESFAEFSLVSLIYYAMKEGACSEQSSRMTAMDNASKNAGDMIGKLTLTYNRTRQAVITRELIEIISGASAL